MTYYINKAGLQVAQQLADFIEAKAIPGTGVDVDHFWSGVADIFARLAPENQRLLAIRKKMQADIDAWHDARDRAPLDQHSYIAFLNEIGYLAPEPATFSIDTANVDPEIAKMAGPQLVVPARNARFVVKAANARWGSLYDAFYGTDALAGAAASNDGYDMLRGAEVIARVRLFLDEVFPLALGSHADATAYTIEKGSLVPALADPHALVGYNGPAENPSSLLLRHNGLHVEIRIDRNHPIGATDKAGVADVLVEAALSTIVDLEDSIAAVDADDKVEAYGNWLSLMRGDLCAVFNKGGKVQGRELAEDRHFRTMAGDTLTLPGRSLLMVRNVGHLMTTPALLLPDGREAPEGILDAIVTTLCGLHDLNGLGGTLRNSRTGSLYVVKPKMHGPDEAAFASAIFDAVEDLLGLARNTVKIGLMDEERRTSANLAACIHALRHRIMFINTGFLDRTGDEIHTSMHAGPMVRKADMKSSAWINAYEKRNVAIGLACGLSGRAQIGKGMWAQPDNMAAMLREKSVHPLSGANTAWVPSPTAAALHALHYHYIDVFAWQREISSQPIPPLEDLLTIPVATNPKWSEKDIIDEIRNNAQGILGYVVRWVNQGIGCSKVPDIHDVGLMEDRATLRISSQHLANWLRHNIITSSQVKAVFAEMAAKVDGQNARDPAYQPMSEDRDSSFAYQAALALVFDGETQPSGYTEPLLHAFRLEAKDVACENIAAKSLQQA